MAERALCASLCRSDRSASQVSEKKKRTKSNQKMGKNYEKRDRDVERISCLFVCLLFAVCRFAGLDQIGTKDRRDETQSDTETLSPSLCPSVLFPFVSLLWASLTLWFSLSFSVSSRLSLFFFLFVCSLVSYSSVICCVNTESENSTTSEERERRERKMKKKKKNKGSSRFRTHTL